MKDENVEQLEKEYSIDKEAVKKVCANISEVVKNSKRIRKNKRIKSK